MVRGCQKKMIYLKNTGSEVFDEAYFVIGDKNKEYDLNECDLVKEANRILGECVLNDENVGVWQKCKDLVKKTVIPFVVGMVVGIIVMFFIK